MGVPGVTKRAVILTPAELQVMRQLLRDGSENGVIAGRIGISEHTVKSHIKAILTKTRASNRTHAAIMFYRGDLIVPDIFEDEGAMLLRGRT